MHYPSTGCLMIPSRRILMTTACWLLQEALYDSRTRYFFIRCGTASPRVRIMSGDRKSRAGASLTISVGSQSAPLHDRCAVAREPGRVRSFLVERGANLGQHLQRDRETFSLFTPSLRTVKCNDRLLLERAGKIVVGVNARKSSC